VAALSLREVARRVGMRAPSLYEYFASKDAIYDALFADGYEQFLASTAEWDEVAAGVGMEEGFRHAAREFIRFCMADHARYQLLFLRTIPGFEPSAESYDVSVQALSRVQQRFHAWGLDDDALDLWTALSIGLVTQQISNDPGGDRWARRTDDAVAMFLAHVRPRRRTTSKSKTGG
jgi:AcrR family transcriptional regulator